MAFQLYVDTGGTFTDVLSLGDDGSWRRLKVLSSSALRFTVRSADCIELEGDDATTDVRLVLHLEKPLPCAASTLIGYTVYEASSGERIGTVTNSPDSSHVLALHTTLAPTFASDIVFELRSPEPAPLFAARLLTQTPLGVPLPDVSMRLATTRGTNALLERKGMPPILVADIGLGDLPIIGTQQRPDLFALQVVRPKPIHGSTIEYRQGASTDEITRLISELEHSGLFTDRSTTPVAIALRNSWRDPSAEKILQSIFRAQGFLHVSTSSALAPLIRLLPRMQTTIVDAYLSPVLDEYLSEVQRSLGEGALRVMHSAGGLESRDAYHAKDSLLSGPAAGVKGVEAIGILSGYKRLIGFDMGGTSTDVCRIDGSPDLAFEHRIGDVTIFAPMLAIETVAAGGGSICGIRNGELYVGPESAGAHPGPACYGAGGPLTITDVNLLSGRLREDGFGIPLNREHAQRALNIIAEQWEQDPDMLLDSWIQLANERMAEAIKRISVRKGYDPSEYALVSFGGAGGQHACAVATLLGIKTVLFPADAGLLSAWGLRYAHREQVVERQVLLPLERGLDECNRFIRTQIDDNKREVARVLLGVRFKGMDSVEWIQHQPNLDVRAAFLVQFENIYGFIPDREIELESVRLQLREPQASVGMPDLDPLSMVRGPRSRQKVRMDGSWKDVTVIKRHDINRSAVIHGSILALDPYATTFVEPGWETRSDVNGTLIAQYRGNQAPGVGGELSHLARLSLDASRLQSIALEMGEQLQRTALSVNVKERLDFSCAVLDPDGYLVVNAPHIPVHLGALGMCVRSVIRQIELGLGDVVVTNHPAFGGSHLPDVTVISAVHAADGTMLGYVANRAHHAEIGGIRPGSMPPSATNLEQEGVVIPPTLLFKSGLIDWSELDHIFASAKCPSRNIEENRADILAAVAANRTGAQRLIDLADALGSDRLLESMGNLRNHARSRLKEASIKWDLNETESAEMLDDGSLIRVNMRREYDRVIFDFSGTSAVHPGNLNATPAIVHSAVMYVLRTLIDDELPLNEGLLDDVEIILPEGCMLNPVFSDDPSECPAVVGGNVETSQRLVDTLLKPFGRVACSQGTMNNLLFGNERFGYYETICGGTGAGPDFDGTSGVHHHMTNTRITDPEVLEWRYPAVLEEFKLREGSGGSGRYRGGDGVVRKIRFSEPVDVSVLSQHRKVAPYGIAGGSDGAVGRQWIERADGRIEDLGGIDQARLEAGDAIVIETPGGGGSGSGAAESLAVISNDYQ
jgi:5-oxoprolinase (ATP-hydrolysing)